MTMQDSIVELLNDLEKEYPEIYQACIRNLGLTKVKETPKGVRKN